MYPKIDFNTRTWYKMVIIIIGTARKRDVKRTKLDQLSSGMSWLSSMRNFPAAHKNQGFYWLSEEVMVCAMSLLANFFKQKAAIRLQKVGLKAAAAKRPHFAHGWFRLSKRSLISTSHSLQLLQKDSYIYFLPNELKQGVNLTEGEVHWPTYLPILIMMFWAERWQWDTHDDLWQESTGKVLVST